MVQEKRSGSRGISGTTGQVRKVDKGGENTASSNALWDLFNLLVPAGSEGGETVSPARQPMRQPMGMQPPGMLSQPTDSGVGTPTGFSNQDVFGQGFATPGMIPPMPERNPAFASMPQSQAPMAPRPAAAPPMPMRAPQPNVPMPQQNPNFHQAAMPPGWAPTDPIEAMFMQMMASQGL